MMMLMIRLLTDMQNKKIRHTKTNNNKIMCRSIYLYVGKK